MGRAGDGRLRKRTSSSLVSASSRSRGGVVARRCRGRSSLRWKVLPDRGSVARHGATGKRSTGGSWVKPAGITHTEDVRAIAGVMHRLDPTGLDGVNRPGSSSLRTGNRAKPSPHRTRRRGHASRYFIVSSGGRKRPSRAARDDWFDGRDGFEHVSLTERAGVARLT